MLHTHPSSLMRGVSGDDPEDGARSGGPRQRLVTVRRGGSAPALGALRPGPEARPAQNRHGGAPRGGRPSPRDARRLASAWRVRNTPNGCLASTRRSFGAPPPLISGARSKGNKTWAQKRAAGTKKRVLFDK